MISVWGHTVKFCSKFTINPETFLCRRNSWQIWKRLFYLSSNQMGNEPPLTNLNASRKMQIFIPAVFGATANSKIKFCSGHLKSNNGSVVLSKETIWLSTTRKNKPEVSFYKTMTTRLHLLLRYKQQYPEMTKWYLGWFLPRTEIPKVVWKHFYMVYICRPTKWGWGQQG